MDFQGIEVDPAMMNDFTLQVVSGLAVAAIVGPLALSPRYYADDKPKQQTYADWAGRPDSAWPGVSFYQS